MANQYYSGQGSFYVGERDAVTGKPLGLVELGNVPSMQFSIEVDKFEHKESESGSRVIDLTIIKEKKGSFTMTVENLSLANLALGFYGTDATVTGAAVVNEELVAYTGRRSPLDNPNLDDAVAPVVEATNGLTATAWAASTAYSAGAFHVPTTAPDDDYYFEVTTAGTSAASEPTWDTTPGNTTVDGTVTWTCRGLILKVATTDYTVDNENGVLIIPSNSVNIYDGESLTVDYTFKTYAKMDAFTETSLERYLRFEGLNTVDGKEVIIDFYRAQIDPSQNLELINEELGSMTLNGTILFDELRPEGSQFFRQVNIS